MRTVVTALGLFVAAHTVSATPWAAEVISYDPGVSPETEWGTGAPFTNASTALGPVSPSTGIGEYAGPVTMFNSPYLLDEIVSIGSNGSLVVKFDMPAPDLPGADFIVYGNAAFWDLIWTDDTKDLGVPAAMLGADGGQVEVSPDGFTWQALTGEVDSLFPTQPWADADSTVPAQFGKPMPDGLTLADFDGLSFEQALVLYEGSAGGTAFDFAPTGWSEIEYVRVSYHGMFNAEIDAIRVVPEPGTLALVALGVLGVLNRRRS